MPTINLSKKELERHLGKKLPLETLKDRISMLGTDLEEVTGDNIKVEIFPNRPDLLSEQGFARALASFIGIKNKTGLKDYHVKDGSKQYQVIIDESVEMRPFTACAIVKNLKLTDQNIKDLMQLQEKLATTHGRNRKKSAYGLYPLKKIKFPIKYTAKDPKKIKFKPLGFETEMSADKVQDIHPTAQKYKHLTGNWTKFPFFIDSNNKILSMVPFINSNDLGKVDTKTSDIFIECTGTNLTNIQIALNIIVTTLADMGGEIYSLNIKYPSKIYKQKNLITPNLTAKSMPLDINRINKLLGLNLTFKDAKKWLERMGFAVKIDANNTSATVLIPSYRSDILHQVDFAEDIAIAYGYENFEAIMPQVATIAKPNKLNVFIEKIKSVLIGFGLLEIKNYHLIKLEELTTLMQSTVSKTAKKANKNGNYSNPVTLANSLGDHNTLRDSLIPSSMKVLSTNQHHEYPQNIFECGRVFHKNSKLKIDTGIKETENLAITLCHDKADFTQIKQILDTIARETNLNLTIKEMDKTNSSNQIFIPGRSAQIYITKDNKVTKNQKSVGKIGEIHPQVLENWGLKMPAVSLELDLELLFNTVQTANK